MSNIYIQEPPSNGKVLLTTSVGDIDVELWSKEAPKACRNFVQLCLEGYYDNTVFHRLVKDFIVQGGDPEGSGEGGESIYGKPFKDEFHTRLRFVRRGLVAMANAGPHDNSSQFFFTLAPAPELQNKHTIFGKVVGDTLYNMIKLADSETDGNDRPLYPHQIISTKVLSNPFDDIEPRVSRRKDKSEESHKKKSKSKATKNFSLLSFGEEAEEEEQGAIEAAQNLKHKAKSSHDLLQDARLSSLPAVAAGQEAEATESTPGDNKRKDMDTDSEDEDSEVEREKEEVKERIRKKLKQDEKKERTRKDDTVEETGDKEEKKSLEELKEEVRALKRDLSAAKKRKEKREEEKQKTVPAKTDDPPTPKDDPLAAFHAERQKYADQKASRRKGAQRETATLDMLNKFKSKLSAAQRFAEYDDEEEEEEEMAKKKEMEEKNKKEEKEEEDDDDDDGGNFSWLSHKLEFEGKNQKVIDANVTDSDRYEIFDPRNPINKRRREASKHSQKGKR